MAAASATSVTTSESSAPASASTPRALATTSASLSPVSSTTSHAVAAREVGDDGGGDVAEPLHHPRVEPLDGGRAVGEERGRGVGRLGHRRVAEHDEPAERGVGDQPHRRAEHHGERALAAHQGAGDVEAALGQQVLERVARHLPAEAAELRADRGQLARHELVQIAEDARAGAVRPEVQPLARAGDDVERHDVVRRPAVAEGPGAAGVVADHPADRAAVVRARVGPEAQAVRPGRRLQGRLDDARLDRRRPRTPASTSSTRDRYRLVSRTTPGPDRVAGDGGARARAASAGRRATGTPRARRPSRRRAAGRTTARGSTRYSEASEE